MSIQQKIIFSLLMVALQCQGQLVLKATIRIDAHSARTMVNETTGAIIPENLVPQTEDIIHTVGDIIYTRNRDKFKTESQESLKKYRVQNTQAVLLSSFKFQRYAQVIFFKNGSFLLVNGGEELGKDLNIYSNEFQLLNTITPFSSGVNSFHFHSCDDLIAIGANQSGKNISKLLAFDSSGKLLFERQIDIEGGEISKILCSKDFFSVYSIDPSRGLLTLSVFDKIGSKVWARNVDWTVQDWTFVQSEVNTLVIATYYSLLIYDAQRGGLLAEKKIAEIYDDAKLIKRRTDGYAKTVGISSLSTNGQLAVLLSEVATDYESNSNLLYIFKNDFHNKTQTIKLQDSKGMLRMKSNNNELLIFKNNEVAKYEYVFEK
jgi:hypothetical protein